MAINVIYEIEFRRERRNIIVYKMTRRFTRVQELLLEVPMTRVNFEKRSFFLDRRPHF